MCRVWELVGPKGSEGVGLFAFFSNEKGFLAVSWVWYRRFDFFAYLWYHTFTERFLVYRW